MTLPAPDLPLPRFSQKGRGETLDFPLYAGGSSVVAPSSGTFSLLDADRRVVIAETAATITNGVMTYALASTFADAYTLPQDEWTEAWKAIGLAGAPATMTFEHRHMVCRVAPKMVVTPETLFRMHSSWRRTLPKSRADYHEPIREAWDELVGRMLGDGHLPHRVLNWHAVAVVHKYWAAHIVARDFATDAAGDSKWERLADSYWERAEHEYEHHLGLQKDNDEDGVPDHGAALQKGEPELFLTNVPAIDPGWGWPR